MRVTCVGGGPGGLFCAIAVKRAAPASDVRVMERFGPAARPGWGIGYWDDLLAGVRRVDPATARRIRAGSVAWTGQRVHVGQAPPVHLGGTGFGMERRLLLEVLTRRAHELGIGIELGAEVTDLDAVSATSDLVVLADGAGSSLRASRAAAFGTAQSPGANRHLWLGSRAPFRDFTFAFERSAAGWLWLHAYASGRDASTVIVECSDRTWRGLGFDAMDDATCRAELSRLFADRLDGAPLENRGESPAAWSVFRAVTNRRWADGNVVLLGDAAHATHFSIGSGTRLAFEDGATLARALATAGDPVAAARCYAEARPSQVAAWQREAARSARWFEEVAEHVRLPPVEFGYALRTRRAHRDSPATFRGLHYRLHQATQRRPGRIARRVVSKTRRRVSRFQEAARHRVSGEAPGP